MNFFSIIGAQRSGTTFLYHLLDEHPEINMAKPIYPEPKFFMNPELIKTGKENYLSKYFNNNYNKVLGEKGTSYIESEKALKAIQDFFPEVKILILLRNPVYRAISNYYFSYKNGLETRTLTEVFIHKLPEPKINKKISVSPFNYLERGIYHKYLKKVFEIFPRDNIKIILYEELVNNYNQVREIFKFLGVTPLFNASKYNTIVNNNPKSSIPSKKVINYLFNYYAPYNKYLEAYINTNIWQKPDNLR